MAPHQGTQTLTKSLSSYNKMKRSTLDVEEPLKEYKVEIVWENVGKFIFLHSLWFYSLFCFHLVSWKTILFNVWCFFVGGIVSRICASNSKR